MEVVLFWVGYFDDRNPGQLWYQGIVDSTFERFLLCLQLFKLDTRSTVSADNFFVRLSLSFDDAEITLTQTLQLHYLSEGIIQLKFLFLVGRNDRFSQRPVINVVE